MQSAWVSRKDGDARRTPRNETPQGTWSKTTYRLGLYVAKKVSLEKAKTV